MHVYFSGIGGSGMSSMALLAKQAGYEVSGSDAQASVTLDYLKAHGISNIHIGQTKQQIAQVHKSRPIDWFIYTSAIPLTDPNHPELEFCQQSGIKCGKRDEFLGQLITDKDLKLLAVAGTHGKSTTTAMLIWLAKELGIKASWVVGAKLGFDEPGHFEPDGQYFIYEADEFDRNFLSFYPHMALISGIDWDHPDIYPSRESYLDAFREFLSQSQHTVLWHDDAEKLGVEEDDSLLILDDSDPSIDTRVNLAGRVNRLDAWLVAKAVAQLPDFSLGKNLEILNRFPGLSRRFEKLDDNIYSDYAHTPPKIRGALQLAREVGGDSLVVIYEGLHNLRQHFIKDELAHLFDDVKKLYVVPSYLAREDKNLELLTPAKIVDMLSNASRQHAEPAQLGDKLLAAIKKHADDDDTVLCFSAGGAGSLDEWLRRELKTA